MGQNFQHRLLAWQRRWEVPQVQIQEVVRPKGTAVKVISQLWRFIKSAMKHGLSEYFEWRNQGFGGCHGMPHRDVPDSNSTAVSFSQSSDQARSQDWDPGPQKLGKHLTKIRKDMYGNWGGIGSNKLVNRKITISNNGELWDSVELPIGNRRLFGQSQRLRFGRLASQCHFCGLESSKSQQLQNPSDLSPLSVWSCSKTGWFWNKKVWIDRTWCLWWTKAEREGCTLILQKKQ